MTPLTGGCVETGPSPVVGKNVFINLNDEAGREWYSVEYEDDIGNWLDSFDTLELALSYIAQHELKYDAKTGFRDTRYLY